MAIALAGAASCQLVAGIDSRSVYRNAEGTDADVASDASDELGPEAAIDAGAPCSTENERKCAAYNEAMVCLDGHWTSQPCAGATPGCRAGECISSCKDLPLACGPNHDTDCCAHKPVPGGTVARSYDGVNFTDPSFTATVSPFELDVYEVTVGRFRNFVLAYPDSLPRAGDGKNAKRGDPGWQETWSSLLPAGDVAQLLTCTGGGQTYSSTAALDQKPVNCVNWYLAYAFCLWDGGRLPTEAEWSFAAQGGGPANAREYPWDASVPPVDRAHVVYDCWARSDCLGMPDGGYWFHDVGSVSPTGDGLFGHSDLVGNVSEWMVDIFHPDYPLPCDDCADFRAPGNERSVRGGNYLSPGGLPGPALDERERQTVLVGYRFSRLPGQGSVSSRLGFRCAR